MSGTRPLSDLTLGEADSFLENIIAQTQGSGVSDLNSSRVGEDVFDGDKAEKLQPSHEAMSGIMSKFNFGSSYIELGTSAVRVEPTAVMTATCVALSAASHVVSLKLPDVTVQKVLDALQRIDGKLDKQLKAPLNKAIDYYKTVMNAVKTGNFKLAFEKLPLLIDNANTAFHYTNEKEIKIESYRECCKAIRLLVFGTILQASYDEEKRVFLSPDKLPKQSLDFIQSELDDIIRRSSEQKNNVKLKSFGLFKVAKKSEVQDLLDSILKITYPYISQARQLTDMNKQLTYSRSASGPILKFRLLPEALPEGYEDRTPVIIGFQTNEKGIKSVVKIHVWKDRHFVWYEREDDMFYKRISSESDPVDMEDAESGHLALTVRKTPRVGKRWSMYHYYTITEKEHRGHPVYSGGRSPAVYLFSTEDGGWAISATVGGPPYKDEDIAVTVLKNHYL